MNKKYKLIKEIPYPNPYKIGDIVDTNNGEVIEDYFRNKLNLSKFPEFWEEMVEKNYEILSLSCVGVTGKLTDKKNIDAWENDFKGNYFISSVKRLSDNEVFSIGDKITNIKSDWKNVFIDSFKISNTDLLVVNSCGGKHYISDIALLKPLFTTEDGVGIYESDDVWFYKLSGKYDEIWKKNVNDIGNVTWDGSDGILQFSTKESAQEYVIKNKPVLSYKMLEDWGLFELEFPIERSSLLDFIKSKIDE